MNKFPRFQARYTQHIGFITERWFHFKQLVHEVVKLVTDVGVPLALVLAPPDHVIIVAILLTLEHPAHAPGEREHEQLAQHVQQLAWVPLKIIHLVPLGADNEKTCVNLTEGEIILKIMQILYQKTPTVLSYKMGR